MQSSPSFKIQNLTTVGMCVHLIQLTKQYLHMSGQLPWSCESNHIQSLHSECDLEWSTIASNIVYINILKKQMTINPTPPNGSHCDPEWSTISTLKKPW